MIVRALIVWLALVVLAVMNGAMRELLITPRFGQLLGHVASTITLCALIVGVTRVSINWIAPTTADAWAVGIAWLGLTGAFEFLAGHYVFGTPWEEILADYDVLRGRIWILVLLVTLMAPRLAVAWREKGRRLRA